MESITVYARGVKMEKITLVCTSLNSNKRLLNKMIDSAKQFDCMLLHQTPPQRYMSIKDAYNMLISNAQTEWICAFPDDDYFYHDGLRQMIAEVHKGIDADVAHFKLTVSGYRPPQDLRAWLLGSEYELCERKPITAKLLEKHNRLPAGSFFRKSAWSKVGGFQGDKCHDHNLWLRMAQAGCKFKFYDHLVYNYVRRDNSAWIKQNKNS